MPLFISHSHQDKDFVDKLAGQLVMNKAYVWLDRWEIKVGDSLLGKVQAGIKSASALLIILLKTSVASEWCKKELNAGLMRELEEKRVVVLPLLLEDCDIPIFLKEKKYADFRKDFDAGLRETLIGISSVTSDSQGRIEQPNFHTDFGIAWGNYGPYYCLQLRFVDHSELISYSVLTEIRIICNARLTEKFSEYELEGLAPLGRLKIITALNDFVRREKPKPFMLEDSLPKTKTLVFHDHKTDIGFEAEISSIRLGQDTGMNTLIDWPRHVEMMWKDLNGIIKSKED